jgi:hypothetical protein
MIVWPPNHDQERLNQSLETTHLVNKIGCQPCRTGDSSRIELRNKTLKRGHGVHFPDTKDRGITYMPAQNLHVATLPWLRGRSTSIMSRSSLIDVRTAVAGQRVPRLGGSRLLGSVRELRRDYLGTISRAADEIGGLARISAGPPGWRVTFYSVSSPELAAEILGQPDRFRKNGPGYRELRRELGENLLTAKTRVGTDSVGSSRRSSRGAASPAITSTS